MTRERNIPWSRLTTRETRLRRQSEHTGWHHVKVISPDGNGTASASPDKAVAGTEITLTATPKEGYRFKEWQVVSPAGLVITEQQVHHAGQQCGGQGHLRGGRTSCAY